MNETNDNWFSASNCHCCCKPISCDEKIALFNTWRKLWEQHVMWTRSLIISKVDDLGDIVFVADRLLQNPGDMGEELVPFFKEKCIDIFTALFEEHLLLAAQLVDAAIAGDSALVDSIRIQWFRNADEIAHLMHEFFPSESEANWRDMMHEHLRITEEEAVLRIEKRYEENVAIYDTIETQALGMADMVVNGIIKEFFKT